MRCAGALIVIAAAALAFALFSADPSDAEGQPCGDGVVWSYADGTLAISYTGTGTGAMDDFQYMASDVPWSQHRLEITKITIGDGVTAVGEWSFGVLNNLASVTVADSVKSIGADQFFGCGQLASINMPASLESVGEMAFHRCLVLKNVVFGDRLKEVSNNQFFQCEKLETVGFGKSPVRIGDSVFSGCDSLTTVGFGNAVYIGEGQFIGCGMLEGAVLPSTVTHIGGFAFARCTGMKTLVLPADITEIPQVAFNECSSLATVDIPDSVVSIGETQFKYCTSLKTVTFGSGLRYIEASQFEECSALESLEIPDSVQYIRKFQFSNCTSLAEADVGKGVLSLGMDSFYGCTELKTVTFRCLVDPERTESYLTYYAETVNGKIVIVERDDMKFSYNTLSDIAVLNKYTGDMTDLTVSELSDQGRTFTVYIIDNFQFEGNHRVRNVVLGDGVYHVGEYAFYDTYLEGISFGKGLGVIFGSSVYDYTFSLDDAELEVQADALRGRSFAGPGGSLCCYTVVLDMNGGSSESVSEDTGWTDLGGTRWSREVPKGFVPEIQDPVREGYVFSDWDPDMPRSIGSRLETEAVWLDAFTVRFDVRGHGTAPGDQTVGYGCTVAEPGEPCQEGFVFKGWYSDASCTVPWDFGTDIVTGDMTLYAAWIGTPSGSLIVVGPVAALAAVILVWAALPVAAGRGKH